jgi:hypothetical protein
LSVVHNMTIIYKKANNTFMLLTASCLLTTFKLIFSTVGKRNFLLKKEK